MKSAITICGIVSGLIIALLANVSYHLDRDIESVMHRAQVAADVPDMLKYMKDLKRGLAVHDMRIGHTALFFKTPANDLYLFNVSVNQIIFRLDEVKNLPHSEATYQVALDDIRGTIRELEHPSDGIVFTRYWFLHLIALGVWVWPAILSSGNRRYRYY